MNEGKMEEYNLPESRARWKEYNGTVFKAKKNGSPLR